LVLSAGQVAADPVTFVLTRPDIDFVVAGISGVGDGSGTITLAGIGAGTVDSATLYWHGIDTGGDGIYDNATVTFAGSSVTGTNIGDATTNCWGAGSSSAYRANVTSLVPGDGAYLVSGLAADTGHGANGASLVVTFDDGDAGNNRDLSFFEGNDSNIPDGFPGEDDGWHGVLAPIDYDGAATVSASVHLADGQNFSAGLDDGPLVFTTANGMTTILDALGLYDGDSVPTDGTSRAGNGELWDIHTFDITAAFGGVADAAASLALDGMEFTSDCLGLTLVLIDLPAGAAPPAPCIDDDMDGYGNPGNPECDNPEEDCDDLDPDVNPAGTEGPGGDATCSDGKDNDCDGLTDEDDPDCAMLVTLESFEAKMTSNGVEVTWTTGMEIDNVGFRLLRHIVTTDGYADTEQNFELVAPFIPSQGDELTGASYEFVDRIKPARTLIRYYLEDIDIFGRVTRHGPVTVGSEFHRAVSGNNGGVVVIEDGDKGTVDLHRPFAPSRR
jgi:hypothetical protein